MTPDFPGALRAELRRWRFTFNNELALQNQLEQVLAQMGLSYSREHRLSNSDIPDFFVDGVAIEVKVRGSLDVHLRQLKRYAEYEAVTGTILIMPKGTGMPDTISGKPAALITLWRNRL